VWGLIPRKVLKSGAAAARSALLIGFDPVAEYMRELQAAFGAAVLLFNDPLAGDVVGIVLRPPTVLMLLQDPKPSKAKPLKVKADGVIVKADASVAPALKSAMPKILHLINQMVEMGEGLIAGVEVNLGSANKLAESLGSR